MVGSISHRSKLNFHGDLNGRSLERCIMLLAITLCMPREEMAALLKQFGFMEDLMVGLFSDWLVKLLCAKP